MQLIRKIKEMKETKLFVVLLESPIYLNVISCIHFKILF